MTFLRPFIAAYLLLALAICLGWPHSAGAKPAPKVCRSAVSGKVVTPAYAAANTATTVCARRKAPVRR